MKTLLKISIIIFASIISISLFGQHHPPKEGHNGQPSGPPPIPSDEQIVEIVSQIADEVSLDDKQEIEVLELYRNHFIIVKKMTSTDKRPPRDKMEQLKKDFEDDVMNLLSEEQNKKYKKYLKKQKPHHRPPPPNGSRQ